jgi:hypothetical protein
MSGSGSEAPTGEPMVAADDSDDAPVRLSYGPGGVPLYVAILWVAFLIAYVVVMSILALPDLRAWIRS